MPDVDSARDQGPCASAFPWPQKRRVLWGCELVRRICLHNRDFHTLKKIEEVVETQFLEWSLGSETLRRLCALNSVSMYKTEIQQIQNAP
jgi:hypothetical protein